MARQEGESAADRCMEHSTVRDHAASLAQLAMVPEGREALCRDPSVRDALRSVAEAGLCEEARQHAESALLALNNKQLHVAIEGQKHVMLSCEWLRTA